MSKRLLLVVGSLNADQVVTMPRFPAAGETVLGSGFAIYPGGKGANQAYAAGRLVNGSVAVGLIGQVGGDAHADLLRQSLAAIGVDTRGITTDASVSTGTAVIGIDGSGQNQIVIVPGSNGTFGVEAMNQHAAALGRAAFVLLQLEIPLATVEAAARIARKAGACVILDPAPARALPSSLLALCDYVTPNESELRTLLGEPGSGPLSRASARIGADKLRERGARHVIVKMGGAGALLVGAGEEIFFPAFPVDAVDTTAAGDAWNGAFAAALAEGQPVKDAGRFACAAAAIAVTRPGAQPSMPSRADVLSFLASHA